MNLPQKSINKDNSFDNFNTDSINKLIIVNSRKGRKIVDIKKFVDINYNTNLHLAVLNNSYKMVEYFLQKDKSNIFKKNKNGNTPLHIAVQKGNLDIIKLLMDKGSDIMAKNKNGDSVYDLSSKEIRKRFNMDIIYKKKHYW